MKIVSFGDSFIFGTELTDNVAGNKAWPALIAKELGVDYETCAIPGCGNDAIARQVYTYFKNNTKTDTLAIINWTWAARWDLFLIESNEWVTLGSSCKPVHLDHHISREQSTQLLNTYNEQVGNSLINNRWRSLQAISSVQRYLADNNILSVQTCIDPWLFSNDSPDYILELQQSVQQQIQSFEGMGFLDWARAKGYTVTEPGWHPLEDAHNAAKNLWIDSYRLLLSL